VLTNQTSTLANWHIVYTRIHVCVHAYTHTCMQDLIKTAEKSGARILLPSGAVAGMDGLTSLAVGPLHWFVYIFMYA
jgi:predicted dinucleotide-utilizing enzyme